MSLGERWLAQVHDVGCVLCRHLGVPDPPPAPAHHIREGQGMSQRSKDFMAVALCYEHHQGVSGFHGLGTRGFYRRYKLDELDLLAMTIEAVARRLL